MLNLNHASRSLEYPPWSGLTRLVAVALALIGFVGLFKGLLLGFSGHGHEIVTDLRERYFEVTAFMDRYYPNPGIDPRAARPGLVYSVYPPYAFPLMVPLFPGGRMIAGQISVALLSLVSMVVMARWGYRQLLFAGRPMAWLGAASSLALNGAPQSLATLQFSLICTGLLLLQEELLERRRTWAAGLCWALAMIKPQIALPFALLFVWRSQWRGLVAGLGLLLGLSFFCSGWTGISLFRIGRYWLRGKMFDFARGHMQLLPFSDSYAHLLNPTLLQWLFFALVIVLMLALVAFLGGWRGRVDMINLTGLCSVIGALAFYHRGYDYVMVFPALIALFRMCLLPQGRAGLLIILVALANALLLWKPNNLILPFPLDSLQTFVWFVAGLLLAFRLRDPAMMLRHRSVPSVEGIR